MKEIILVGYSNRLGNFVPCFFFDTQQDFETWMYYSKILDGNFSIYKFKVPFYYSLSYKERNSITDFLKKPLL